MGRRKKVFVWSLARKQRQKKLGMIALHAKMLQRTEPMAVPRSREAFPQLRSAGTTSAELAFRTLCGPKCS
jgi:hypothetical protein